VHHPAAEGTRLDAVDREATEVERMRGVRYQIPLNMGNSRTPRQARDLTRSGTVFDNSHDHEVTEVLRQRPRPELPRKVRSLQSPASLIAATIASSTCSGAPVLKVMRVDIGVLAWKSAPR
jgi:hypothetical protein